MVFYHPSPWIQQVARPSLLELNRLRELRLCERYIDEGYTQRWDRFRHQPEREALYAHLDAAQRTGIHRQIAGWLTRHTPGLAGRAALAYHLERAGQVIEAVEAYLEASAYTVTWGIDSESMQAVLAAERLLARQETKPTPEVLLKVRLVWAELYLQQGLPDKSVAEANRALEMAASLGDSNAMARCLLVRARCALLHEDYPAVRQDAAEATRLAQTAQNTDLLSQAQWLQARALFATERPAEGARLLMRAVDAGAISNLRLDIEMHLDAVNYLLNSYQRDRAYQHAQHALRQAERLSDPMVLHQVLARLGHLKLLYGEAEAALDALEKALKLPTPSDAGLRLLARVLTDHASALCYLGRYADADASFDTAYDYFAQENDLPGALTLQITRAHELYLDRNELDLAHTALDQAHSNAAEFGQLGEGLRLLTDLIEATLYFRHQEYPAASALLQQLETQPEHPARQWYAPLLQLLQAEQAVAQGQLDQANQYLHRALGSVGVQGDLRYLTAIYSLLAEVKILHDEPADAIQDALERAVRTGRQQGRRIHLARALLLMGQQVKYTSHRHSTRARASAFLFEADLLYKEMGLPMPTLFAAAAFKAE
jgi:tetratricopeptide (TPR) repeat protein